jgi:hypothetical protein
LLFVTGDGFLTRFFRNLLIFFTGPNWGNSLSAARMETVGLEDRVALEALAKKLPRVLIVSRRHV